MASRLSELCGPLAHWPKISWSEHGVDLITNLTPPMHFLLGMVTPSGSQRLAVVRTLKGKWHAAGVHGGQVQKLRVSACVALTYGSVDFVNK